MYGEETVPFPETLNYTLNLTYQESLEMSGDKLYSPDSESAPITTYYSHSPDIQTYQKMPLLHVYIQLWPLRKNFPLENLPRTYAHVIDINIKHARAQVWN